MGWTKKLPVPEFFPAQQSLLSPPSNPSHKEHSSCRQSNNSCLTNPSKDNVAGSKLRLEVLRGIPAPLLSKRRSCCGRWAIIIHSCPVCGDSVNHSSLWEKDANEDVMRAAPSAAISQFISILSLRGATAETCVPTFHQNMTG